MPVLVSQPRFAARRLVAAGAQHGIEGDQPETREPREAAPQPMRNPGDGVVETHDHRSAGAREPGHRGEGGGRIGRVVEDPVRQDDVEGPFAQARCAQVGLHEERAIDAEAQARGFREPQRRPRQIGADDDPVGRGEEQRHLPGAAPELDDAGVARDRAVEEAGQLATPGASPQRRVAVARRISGEGRVRVEGADRLGARVGIEAQLGNPLGRGVLPSASLAAEAGPERAAAARTGEELERPALHQKIA